MLESNVIRGVIVTSRLDLVCVLLGFCHNYGFMNLVDAMELGASRLGSHYAQITVERIGMGATTTAGLDNAGHA